MAEDAYSWQMTQFGGEFALSTDGIVLSCGCTYPFSGGRPTTSCVMHKEVVELSRTDSQKSENAASLRSARRPGQLLRAGGLARDGLRVFSRWVRTRTVQARASARERRSHDE